jgi:beta-carotene ketolase (CrtW type)
VSKLAAGASTRTRDGQTAIGLGLAGALVTAWLACHVYGMFFHRWTLFGVVIAPALILLQCWLNVGLFIVAHDCMHGSLAPFRPRLNRTIGRLCLGLYAGFSYDRLIAEHFAHHRHSGTPDDPDFHADEPRRFWPWYVAFFRRYFGIREFLILTALLATYLLVLRVPLANALLLWGVPALLSSLQLFYFGTYLPHRHEEEGSFSDRHNARSNAYPPALSLLTCFHFGYHHEHHDQPHVPWWRLPATRSDVQTGRA